MTHTREYRKRRDEIQLKKHGQKLEQLFRREKIFRADN